MLPVAMETHVLFLYIWTFKVYSWVHLRCVLHGVRRSALGTTGGGQNLSLNPTQLVRL